MSAAATYPLAQLVGLLRRSGYVLSVHQVLQLQSAILGSRLLRKDPGQLKYIVAPLVARNAAEQQQVYALVDAFVAARRRNRVVPEVSARVPWWRNRKRLFVLRLALLLLVIGVGLSLLLWQEYAAPVPQAAPIATTPPPVDTFVRTADTPALRRGSTPRGTYAWKLERRHPIRPVPIDYNLPVSGIFGILLGILLFIVLFDRTKTAFVQSPQKKVKPDDGTQRLTHTDGRNEEGAEVLDERPEDVQVIFPDQWAKLAHGDGWPAFRRHLLRVRREGPAKLDIKATILATTRQAGLLHLVNKAPSRSLEYLLVIDPGEEGSGLPALFGQLTSFLLAGRLPARRYRLAGKGTFLLDDRGQRQEWEALLAERPDAQLLLFSKGSFVTGSTGSELARVLASHGAKALVTPVALEDWGTREERLRSDGWMLVPAEEAALVHFGRSLATESPLPEGIWRQLLRGGTTGRPNDFRSLAGLKRYLGNEALFQFLCGLAVYPRVDWNLALALYQSFCENGPLTTESAGPDYATFLRLVRIPWLCNGRLQPELRLELLRALQPDMERWTRETILELLESVGQRDPAQKDREEYRVQYAFNAFFLYVHNEGRYSRYRESKHLFPEIWQRHAEWELRTRVHDCHSGLLPADLSGRARTVDEFLLEEKTFQVRSVRLSKASVLLLPAFATYILFSLLRPQAIYPDKLYEKVTVRLVVTADRSCAAFAGAEVTYPVTQQTVALRNLRAHDTVSIPGRFYGENLEFALRGSNMRETYVPFEASDSVVVLRVGCQ